MCGKLTLLSRVDSDLCMHVFKAAFCLFAILATAPKTDEQSIFDQLTGKAPVKVRGLSEKNLASKRDFRTDISFFFLHVDG